MIVTFGQTEHGIGVYDFGGSETVIDETPVRACVHVDAFAPFTVGIDAVRATAMNIDAFAPTTVSIDAREC